MREMWIVIASVAKPSSRASRGEVGLLRYARNDGSDADLRRAALDELDSMRLGMISIGEGWALQDIGGVSWT